MNVNGQHALLINEFDETTNWYKMWELEDFIRTIAADHPNTYSMAFCNTNRLVYYKELHFGFKTQRDASKFYAQHDSLELDRIMKLIDASDPDNPKIATGPATQS